MDSDTSCAESCPNKHRADVIIVGAGLSGLTSAYKIIMKERSLQVKILEATELIGGQLSGSELGEIGGRWFTEAQIHICNLLRELNIPTRPRIPINTECKRCWDLDRGAFSFLAKYELKRYLRELEKRMHLFKPGRYNIHKEGISMHSHICNRLFFRKSRKLMTNLVFLIAGVESNNITFIQFMTICYSCGGICPLIDIFLECPEKLREFSSSSLKKAFFYKLKTAEILFKRKVHVIHQHNEFVEVSVSPTESYTASAVILAISTNSMQHINFVPQMPCELLKITLPVKTCNFVITSFIAKYTEPHWQNAGYNGYFQLNDPFIVGYEYQRCTYAWMVLHELDLSPFIATISMEKLAKYFGDGMLLPTAFEQRSFEISSKINAPLVMPWKRIIWSSSASAATCFRGFLGGAVQSGLRAAMNALLLVRPHCVTWQDLAEVQCNHTFVYKSSNWFSLWTSTWNVYNVVYYGLFITAIVIVLHQILKN